MNSYGRAGVPGQGNAASGRASAKGSASVGSASVGSASAGGRASVGSASAGGRASVGNASAGGRASVGNASAGGRASVGNASVGSASVARAAVRPAIDLSAPPPPTDGRPKTAKRRRRRNFLTAAAAVLVIMLGAGVVGGTYFFDDVALPSPVTEDQSNVILDSTGAVLARLGDANRTVVPEAQINKVVEHAVAAAEDKNFYTHHGIDVKGIVRAAWNNFTGGATQGASTITQQYARHAADLKAISINRKLREAVIARKLESTYNKDQIMGMYLNYIDLGEGRYGIEAAAQGYFGKSVTTPAGQKNAISASEAAVLASIIKQPYPNSADRGYDPNYNPTGAKDRWEYTMKNMLEMGWISPAEYAARKYPTVRKPTANSCKTCAANKPVGMIFRHVQNELAGLGISQADFDKGGLTITTTIVPDVQKAAEEAGSRQSESSPMHKTPATYQAAVIGIDPNTGRVLGYYGGDKPNGIDYGGYMAGDGSGVIGGQSPGSSFKIYTLAAGLKEGLSFQSTWDDKKKRPNGSVISNAGADPGKICGGNGRNCPLETATIKSYNFPFYWIADAIGRDKVIAAAKAAGLKHMYTDGGKLVDLTTTDKSTWMRNGYFDNEVAFGQYRVPPLEHAEGVATIVAGGVHHPAHFIEKIKRVDPDTGKVSYLNPEKAGGNRVFDADQMANLDGVLKKIVIADNRDLDGGRESIAKSGTWEYTTAKGDDGGSGDCWFVGGIPQLAVTVWVGGKDKRVPLKDPLTGKNMFGANTPSRIWKQFLDTAAERMNWKNQDFPARVTTGEPDKFGNGIKPATPPPTPPVTPPTCAVPVVNGTCDGTGKNDGGGQGNNGGQNGGGTPTTTEPTVAPTVTPTVTVPTTVPTRPTRG
ncbi:transglycosylase domain-containing protein [Actinoplanes sp. KI2]|uniref:transglycosylase domain-containing protein n=1 Tax=Actinoplanes sp. KI2 TaxID=2983315 RepID=UPI0021D5EA7D|nr:transglycosylase domain-containing protein [Actinoplanes sp. KI2]MCU7726018.1 transglycosylase domain-containing protein [Actinoplanes sp. KI2]